MGNALRLIEFLGQILGKAMYEGVRQASPAVRACCACLVTQICPSACQAF